MMRLRSRSPVAQTKNDGQEKNTQVRQKGAAAEDETAGLRQKGEDETFFAKISGKISALIGFINDKPDEFAPDAGAEQLPQRQDLSLIHI